jgi:hypothetical protein
MVKYDSLLNLSKAVAEALQQHDLAKPKEIKKHLQQSGWGNPPINPINKVLTQYLVGQVKLVESGRWKLTQQFLSPVVLVKRHRPNE